MGGTASCLLWDAAYDPIVVAVERGAGAVAPTFVDDMEALACGPRQSIAVATVILVAGHCAGLLAESHACRWLETR